LNEQTSRIHLSANDGLRSLPANCHHRRALRNLKSLAAGSRELEIGASEETCKCVTRTLSAYVGLKEAKRSFGCRSIQSLMVQ